MNQAVYERTSAASTDELRTALVQVLREHFGHPCSVARLERRAFAYTTSFAIEELDVQLDNGARLTMLFKDLSRHALLADAREAKPGFLYEPLREIEMYRKILAPLRLGTAACYGSVVQPELGRYWLFLEKVQGIELYQEGDIAVWQQVAAWLAGLHARFDGQAESLLHVVPLLVYDRTTYRQWLSRAQSMVGNRSGDTGDATRTLAKVATGYDRIIDRLLALPATLLHGEFYASNVLVEKTGNDLRVCAVDWEMAAVGPGLLDLAALVAGAWTETAREAMARAYHGALARSGVSSHSWEEVPAALDCCRLHQAIQWLGWSPNWTPPLAQTQDWLGEALRLAEKLAG